MARARVLALSCLLAGCPTRDNDERSEAAQLSRAVDSLRNADNAAKGAHLDSVRNAACSAPDVCAVRSVCLSGYELHVRALDGLAKAMVTTTDGGNESTAALLGTARADLERSRALTERCTEAQGEMVRRYRVDG
jgi:hypothetical protein